jgi:photosystem II stability/assembly factor-like uncharacterized protein
MIRIINCYFFLLSITMTLFSGENNWTLLGPWGGDVREIVIHPTNPNILYVSCFSNGLFKSTNRGITWERKWDEVMNVGGYDIELHPNNPEIIYFGTYYGIFKSYNGGDSWQKTLTRNMALDVEINPFKPSVLIAAAQRLFQSTDEGNNWNIYGFQNVSVHSVEYNYGYPNVFYVGTNFIAWYKNQSIINGICKTTDGGKTWMPVKDNMQDLVFPKDIQIDATNPNKVYVVGVNQRFYKDDDRFEPFHTIFCSKDGGDTYTCINNGLEVNRVLKILIDPGDTNILYVCTKEKGLCKSTNGGETWTQKNKGLSEIYSRVIACDGQNNILYLGTSNGGLYRSENEAESWEDFSQGIYGSEVSSLALNLQNTKTMYITGTWHPRKSVDGGKNWRRIGINYLDGVHTSQIVIDPVDTNVVYAAVNFSSADLPHGIWRSNDGGATWVEKNNGLPDSLLINWQMLTIPNDSSTILALATFKGFFISYDGAETWEERNKGISTVNPWDKDINTIAIDGKDPNTLYACATQVYKSTNQGKKWQVIRSYAPSGSRWYYEVFVNPHDTQELYVGMGGDIYKSKNGGKTWELYMNNIYMISISPKDANLMLAVRSSEIKSGMMMSWDKGKTWQSMDTGWHRPIVYFLKYDVCNPHKVYAGTVQSGLWSWTIEPTQVTEYIPDKKNSKYNLRQNYPNPFNENTIIEYQVPNNETVNIEIYNLLSQRIVTLVDEKQTAGFHKTSWHGKDESGINVASGVYLYYLNSGNFFGGKKMILLR